MMDSCGKVISVSLRSSIEGPLGEHLESWIIISDSLAYLSLFKTLSLDLVILLIISFP